MKTYKQSYWMLLAALLYATVFPVTSYGTQPNVPPPTEESDVTPPGQRIGAPQVLEIEPQVEEPTSQVKSVSDEVPPPPAPVKTVERTEAPTAEQGVGQLPSRREGTRPRGASQKGAGQRNYIGVLYATAEEGPVGVKVLDVVPGSPAERAGFSGANRPSEGQSSLIKAAIVVLAMSPAGPFAIPLAIAHDMYMTRQTPGDIIVSINNQPVHNAQEFSESMRHYQPGETITFSILRGGKAIQISVQLEEEPG